MRLDLNSSGVYAMHREPAAAETQRASEVTKLLQAISAAEHGAAEKLLPLVYEELRKIARRYFRRQPRSHTLQPTALVHEAYLKLVAAPSDFARCHFVALAARAMRQILVDRAKRHARLKRGGGRRRATIDLEQIMSGNGTLESADILALDECLKKLSRLDERGARMVELRFFSGLNVNEAAETLELSKATAEKDWRKVRAWLAACLKGSVALDTN
jgi:RNA polymerase sigma-70 factor (ECF subfamily)